MIDLLKRFALWLVQSIVGAVFILGSAVLLAEWFAGCGETYIDANQQRHAHECLFIGKYVGVSKP